MSLLEVRDATLRFGGVTALEQVSFDVEEGEVFAVVGPNGAGKSTLFNLISRFHDPVAKAGSASTGRACWSSASAIAGLGIARTFQNIELFERSTVLRNLLVGRHVHRRASIAAQLLFTPSVRREEIAHRERGRAGHRLPRPPAVSGDGDRGPPPRDAQGGGDRPGAGHGAHG